MFRATLLPSASVYGSWTTVKDVCLWAALDDEMWNVFAGALGDASLQNLSLLASIQPADIKEAIEATTIFFRRHLEMRSHSQLPRKSTTPSIHDSPNRSAMSGVGPSVPVHMSAILTHLLCHAQYAANILTHLLCHAQYADPRRTGMAARDRAEAGPSMKAIASSPLPPVSRATTMR